MRELVVALALCACGSAEAFEEAAPPEVDASLACERVFSPSPELLELTTSAARQWAEATGCDVHVGEGGVAITLVPSIENEKGEPQCGATYRLHDEGGVIIGVRGAEISAAPRCRLRARDVLHEAGHALAPRRGHTSEGLMAPAPNGVDYVDAVSAAFIADELLTH